MHGGAKQVHGAGRKALSAQGWPEGIEFSHPYLTAAASMVAARSCHLW